MKTTSRRIFAALVGLCLLSVMVRGAGADDATDYANQLYQAQKEREEWQAQRDQAERDRQALQDWHNQLYQAQKERDEWQAQREQAQRDYDQRQRDAQALQDWHNQLYQAQKEREQWQADRERAQKEWDDWHRQLDQAQKERDDYQKNLDYQQSILDGIERVKQQRDEILSRGQDANWGAGAVQPTETRAVPQQNKVILNPYVLQKMQRQNLEKVRQNLDNMRQQIRQTRPQVTQVTQVRQGLPQMILNPYVRSSP